ncbi:MAG: hypothetical protein H6738_01665 [Alphaproteobacteria bacterium]|nr:hypothetical protein [Alphaproteobacteria bacterium]MCB9695475.1 hypothetical protein [Alphaproteobacteria bacterium]
MLTTLLVTSALASRGPTLGADLCAGTTCEASYATSVDIKLRNAEGQRVLNGILSDEAFWTGASDSKFDNKEYDEIRLKQTDTGYVPMITGEGNQDFPHDVVAHTVFMRNTDLPKYMSGAKAVVLLGSGYDSTVGAEYRDCFYILDLTAFYAYFPQRMYRKHDDAKNQTVLWFEKMDSSFVDAATWTSYQSKMETTLANLDRRWVLNSLTEVGDIYGMFVVEPGGTRESRVSFVSKLDFSSDAGWVAKWGSQMPMVLKSGLKSGFVASVAIAQHEKEKRALRQPTPGAAPAPAPAP